MRRTSSLLTILVLLLAFVAGACGGDDSDGGASGTSEASSDAAGGDESEDFSGKGSGGFCDKLREFEENEEAFESQPDDSAEQQAEKQKKALDALKDLEDEAPDEIKADLRLVVESFEAIVEIYGDGDPTPTAEEQKRLEKFEDPKYEAAGTRVNSYVEKVCEIDADDDGDTDGVDNDAPTSSDDAVEGETTDTVEDSDGSE